MAGGSPVRWCRHRTLLPSWELDWAALTAARDFGPARRVFSSVGLCSVGQQAMGLGQTSSCPSCENGACLSRCFTVCSLFLPRRKSAGYGRWSCLKNRMGWEFRLVEAEDQSAHLTLSLSPKWRKAVPLTGDWITLPFLCFLVLPSPAPGCWGGSQRPGDYILQGRCWSMAGNQALAVLIKYPSEHRKWLMGGATAQGGIRFLSNPFTLSVKWKLSWVWGCWWHVIPYPELPLGGTPHPSHGHCGWRLGKVMGVQTWPQFTCHVMAVKIWYTCKHVCLGHADVEGEKSMWVFSLWPENHSHSKATFLTSTVIWSRKMGGA